MQHSVHVQAQSWTVQSGIKCTNHVELIIYCSCAGSLVKSSRINKGLLTFFLLFNSSTNFQEVSAVLTDKGSLQKIRGIGFDATCSLVALDSTGHAVTVSSSREPHRNTIMWLDHRALDQAQRINNTKHKVLSYVGGGVSPEMEIPKILWLKENLPDDCWEKCALFLELPEFLTYKATGDQTR